MPVQSVDLARAQADLHAEFVQRSPARASQSADGYVQCLGLVLLVELDGPGGPAGDGWGSEGRPTS